jgi:hypothetical protein
MTLDPEEHGPGIRNTQKIERKHLFLTHPYQASDAQNDVHSPKVLLHFPTEKIGISQIPSN